MPSKKNCTFAPIGVGFVLGLLSVAVVPVAWAIRAPSGPKAPLPDYDIRKGYSQLGNLKDPRVAEEMKLLRQQQQAKRAQLAKEGPQGLASRQLKKNEAAVARFFGTDVTVEWNPNGTPRQLFKEDGELAPAQPGREPEEVARHFLWMNREVFHLRDEEIAALALGRTNTGPSGSHHVNFRQTVGGLPVFNADLKVSLGKDNAVLSTGGTLYPGLSIAGAAKLSAEEAAKTALRYLGPWSEDFEDEELTPELRALKQESREAARRQERPQTFTIEGFTFWRPARPEPKNPEDYAPAVLQRQEGPEQKTTLSRGPFLRPVEASLVVFPLSPSQGRLAWQLYLLKAPMEWYALVVDAEDGTLLNRTNLVQFSQPQGLVFLTNPDAGSQVTRSFVGNSTASPNTFVSSSQSISEGNNVFPLHGASDSSGPRHFMFSFTNGYETSGEQDFNLDTAKTIRFTPNGTGGYTTSFPTFADIGAGSNLGMSDDDTVCGPPPTSFTYFGASPSFVCINSNGEVNVGWSTIDFSEDSFQVFENPGRIMGLWDDLNPSAAGTVGVTFTGAILCFRWNSVPEFLNSGSNSFGICLYGSGSGLTIGTIDLIYPSGGVTALDGYVGISPGSRPIFTPAMADTTRTVALTNFSSAEATTGTIGLVKRFPSHADAAAAFTNVFWQFNDTGHDRLYSAGFNEDAGNFQNLNFGRGGLENDPIWLWANGTRRLGTNNAFFATPPDGVCCAFSGFLLFTTSAGFRNVDSAFDSDVIVHEHAHGVTNRLVGGPSNVLALFALQSGALGEGWSDWYALSYANDPVMGEYVTGNPTTGIREVRYDSTSPRNYNQFANLLGPLCCLNDDSTVFFPEVHFDGEIWASALADMRTQLKRGRTGLTDAQVEELVTEGLNFTPANPTMYEARNGIVLANNHIRGNSKGCPIWRVFAARGLGKHAANNEVPFFGLFPAGDSFSVFAAYDISLKCGGSFSRGSLIGSTASFESASVGATTADGWTGTGLWHVSDNRASLGAKSFYYGVEAAQDYNVGTTFGSLTSPALNLSGVTHPVLEFDLALSTEQFFPFDTLWLRVSIDGGSTFPIQRSILFWDTTDIAFTGDLAFHRVRIDLTPPAGVSLSNARLRLTFDSLDPFVNFFEGVYIDNVEIRSYTEQ